VRFYLTAPKFERQKSIPVLALVAAVVGVVPPTRNCYISFHNAYLITGALIALTVISVGPLGMSYRNFR
jgi:hypothetical protein